MHARPNYWDMETRAIFTGPGSWRDDLHKWRQFGNGFPYHCYRGPWRFAKIGMAFENGMLMLLK